MVPWTHGEELTVPLPACHRMNMWIQRMKKRHVEQRARDAFSRLNATTLYVFFFFFTFPRRVRVQKLFRWLPWISEIWESQMFLFSLATEYCSSPLFLGEEWFCMFQLDTISPLERCLSVMCRWPRGWILRWTLLAIQGNNGYENHFRMISL